MVPEAEDTKMSKLRAFTAEETGSESGDIQPTSD